MLEKRLQELEARNSSALGSAGDGTKSVVSERRELVTGRSRRRDGAGAQEDVRVSAIAANKPTTASDTMVSDRGNATVGAMADETVRNNAAALAALRGDATPLDSAPAQELSPSGYPIVSPEQALRAAEIAAQREAEAREKHRIATGGQVDDELAQTILFRETTATLNPRQFEVSQDINYFRNSGFLQEERAVSSITGFRYGFREGFEVGLTVPFYWSRRITKSYDEAVKEDVLDIGDVSASVTSTLWNPASWYPGAALTLQATAPTSRRSPYGDLSKDEFRPGADPRNVFISTQALGHWGTGGLVQFYKTYDPLVLFAGIGTGYNLDKDVGGNSVQPGWRVNYNFGLSFAVSEHSTLGLQFLGSVQEPYKVNGFDAKTGWNEEYRARFALTQRIRRDLYLEPSVAIGMVESAPEASFGLGTRRRF